jgi:hypothetical protein
VGLVVAVDASVAGLSGTGVLVGWAAIAPAFSCDVSPLALWSQLTSNKTKEINNAKSIDFFKDIIISLFIAIL